MLAISANVVGAWAAAIVAFWKGHYFVPGAAFALGFGLFLLVPLVAIALSRMEEIAAIAFGRAPRRLANAPAAGAGRLCAESVDPYPGLPRAGRRCSRPPSMPWRGSIIRISNAWWSINNTPDPAAVAPDRRALPRARRSLQIPAGRGTRRLQGRRPAACARPHRAGRRDHRLDRCRLRRRPGLAQGARAVIRRSPRRLRASAARSSRRRPLADALRHECRICRFLRYRHGAAERGQRHRHARHDVPDPARRDRQPSAAGRARRSSRTPISASRSSNKAGSRITATAVTATVCCPTPSTPISGSAIAGPLAGCNWSASIGAGCCRAPKACRPSRSANTASAGSIGWALTPSASWWRC